MELARSAHVDTFCRDNLPAAELWPKFLFTLPELQYPERLNCAVELLDAVIDSLGADRLCLLSASGDRWTYGELRERANQIANLLTNDYELVPGNRVLLRGPNNPWLAACWFGALKAGCVVVPTMPLLRPKELAAIGDIASIDLTICDARFTDDLTAAAIGVPTIVYGGEDATDLTRVVSMHSSEFANVDTASDDVAMLAFTSGTTGRPKATMHFHRDVLANADTFSKHLIKPTKDDVFTGTPPIAFTFGLGGLIVFPLRVGAATLLIERATPDELADLIAEHGITVCFTAPTAYRAMIASGSAAKLTGLRRAISAGEHLPVATWHAFKDATGLELIDGIGSTEMLHIFVSAADDDIRPGATGKPIPGYRATLFNDDGTETPDGSPGRLAVQGPTGCRYLADDRQQVYVQDGWNITGDTFVRDAEGYYWYQARSDDMIVSSGYNISGPEVEEAVVTHPAVAECAVVGAADEARGSIVTAFIVLTAEASADLNDASKAALVSSIQDHVKGTIAPYKYPRRIEFIEALPRTSTGKVQRRALRDNPPAPGMSPC